MGGLLFVLARRANRQVVNRLLLYLRDWEFGEAPHWDVFKIVSSQDEIPEDCKPDSPPIKQFKDKDNNWAGKTFPELEKFMSERREKWPEGVRSPNLTCFLAFDDQDFENDTITLVQRDFGNDENGEFSYFDLYNKVRLPWDQGYIDWCNLDIANMDFAEFCDQDKGRDKDGWWTYQPIPEHPQADVQARYDETAKEVAGKRDAAIAELTKSADVRDS